MTRTVLNAPEVYEWIEVPQEWRCQGIGFIISGLTSKGKIVQGMFDTGGKDVWRIRSVPDVSNLPDLPMVVGKTGTPVALNTNENANEISAEGARLTLHVKKEQRITSWNVDALGAASEAAYKNGPLLISTRVMACSSLFRLQKLPTKVLSGETDGRPGVECQRKMDEDRSLRIQVAKTYRGRIRVER